jgi:pyruvate ferredoxin oxidoreductase alpha subunit
MNRTLITGNVAAAWGARLASVDYIPAFPITPQTEIIETLADWIDAGEMNARLVTLESEHSMVTAAAAAAATGVRTFTATSSQGLLHAMEMIFTVAGWRVPFVMVNVSRALASPITLEPDHTDVLAARDAGWIQIHCATCQEVLDSILIAYRLAEDPRVRLPVIVNQDGFYLSFTREPVAIPDANEVAAFIRPFATGQTAFRGGQSASQGVAVLGGTPYSYFRYETHLALQESLITYEALATEFDQAFGRHWPAIDAYRTEDAEIVFFMIGAFATKAKDAVDRLREEGWRIGLIRPRLIRPFPEAPLRRHLFGVRAVIVIDQNLSMGKGGVLHAELASAIAGQPNMPMLVPFIGALGGRDIARDEFFAMARTAQEAVESGIAPSPRLLFKARELREVRRLQAIAAVERSKAAP